MNDTVITNAISHVQKKAIWFIFGFLVVIFLSAVIANQKWIYLTALTAPLLIYLSMKKPFIFPFGLYAFLLPFEGVLDSSDGINLSRLLGVLTILVLLLRGTFENKLRKPNAVAIWWVLFVSYGFLSVLWSIQHDRAFGKLVTAVSLLLLYLITVSYKIEKRDYDALKWFIFSGGLLAAVILIHNYITGDFVNSYHMKTSIKVGGQSMGPDVQAFYLLFPISVGILLMLEQKKRILQVFLLIATFTIITGVISTGTRAAFMAICIIFIVYLKSIKKKLTFGIVLLIAVCILIPLIPEHVIEHVGSSTSDQGAGRLSIWMVGLRSLESYWFVGAGFNNFPTAYNEFVDTVPNFRGLGRAPHNIFLGVFVEMGIIGIILLIISLITHYQLISRQCIQDRESQAMLKATFWGMLAHSFFIDTLWIKSFWLLWIMILQYQSVMRGAYNENNEYS